MRRKARVLLSGTFPAGLSESGRGLWKKVNCGAVG